MKNDRRPDSLGSYIPLLFGLMTLSLAVACGGGGDNQADEEHTEEPAEAAAETPMASEQMGGPRVFFTTPEDGATVASPVHLEFGHENFNIEPKGEVHSGAGHHHVGLNTECLPPGEAIPEADPWIHFGDGSATIDMQLPAGEHTLTIQIGDGEHVTLEDAGLCQSITITVSE